LKELELHGFIQKTTYDSKIPKVEYEITRLGESLLPLITELEKWGEDNRNVLESAIQKDLKFGNVIP
jgi:DNA-binding HxlR family transcriptional regulator